MAGFHHYSSARWVNQFKILFESKTILPESDLILRTRDLFLILAASFNKRLPVICTVANAVPYSLLWGMFKLDQLECGQKKRPLTQWGWRTPLSMPTF